jgi:hypothetical protein
LLYFLFNLFKLLFNSSLSEMSLFLKKNDSSIIKIKIEFEIPTTTTNEIKMKMSYLFLKPFHKPKRRRRRRRIKEVKRIVLSK